MNTNKELLDVAQVMLKNVDIVKVETVEIGSTTYDDASRSLTITINYSECKDNKQIEIK